MNHQTKLKNKNSWKIDPLRPLDRSEGQNQGKQKRGRGREREREKTNKEKEVDNSLSSKSSTSMTQLKPKTVQQVLRHCLRSATEVSISGRCIVIFLGWWSLALAERKTYSSRIKIMMEKKITNIANATQRSYHFEVRGRRGAGGGGGGIPAGWYYYFFSVLKSSSKQKWQEAILKRKQPPRDG